MADRGDTHYRVSTLNAWFLVSSLLLLGATVWMMIDDWNAPWKPYQRRARAIEVEMTKAAIETLAAEGLLEKETAFLAEVAEAEQALEARRQELAEAEEALRLVRGEHYVREQAAKSMKAEYDWERFLAEERIALHGDTQAEQHLEAVWRRVAETALAKEEADEALAGALARVDAIRAEVSDAERRLGIEIADLARLRKRMDQLAPRSADVRIANVLRDAPGIDFIGPSLKVDKVVLENLTFELNFTKKKRIDMCMTCHVSIDKVGWEEQEQPLATHPRLDLFLTAKSPHPLKDVGCTICHRGSGEALDFTRADHRPSDAAEGERWAEDYHWHKQHHWDYPMLPERFVEASCVQCHKTSMELIADEAPKLAEGYALFERHGCYSCHKVDWFPTTRRPGPSLKNLQAKLVDSFIEPWIADPRGFRPTTWMPQAFHLENFEADQPVVTSEYGAGPPILGQAWNDTAVSAIGAFLRARAPRQALPSVPVEGDAERGREVFRVVGCLACHNVAPHPGEETRTKDLAFVPNDTNQHGPNLRGVATKITREWLYWWVKDPRSYWPETRMPDLRLSDQDAADVTAYLMDDPDGHFHAVPEGWETAPVPQDPVALREQARWFFSKLGRNEIERRLRGEDSENRWDDPKVLGVAVGEKLVQHYGCFSCHEISGLESEMPIGTELTNWASKTVDKLDFGFSYQVELGGRPKLDHHYHDGWLERKLHAPRSFDLMKIKNPKEKLRMPWFDFTDREVEAIATFMLGLVDDEVQLAKMQPSSAELAMDQGKRVLRQKNCVACHVVEPGRVRFHDEQGELHEVVAELMPLEGESLPPSMHGGLAGFLEQLARYEEDTEEEVDEIGLRLLESAPDHGAPGDTLFLPRDALREIVPPWGGDFVRTVTDYYHYGIELFDPEAEDEEEQYYYVTADPDGQGRVQDVDGQFRAYDSEPYDKIRWTFAPPVLHNEGFKVQPAWFYSFLLDPLPLREQMRVRMPTFTYAPGEAEAVARYFAHAYARKWPSVYARSLRLASGLKPKQSVADHWSAEPEERRPDYLSHPRWPESKLFGEGRAPSLAELAARIGIEPATLAAIEAGAAPEIAASFSKVQAYGDSVGFRMHRSVAADLERVDRRSPSYIAARSAQMPGGQHPGSIGQEVAVRGVNCWQCHFHDGQPPDQKDSPLAWAPDLSRTRERLREDWVHEWIWGPNLIYPGTAMPANFLAVPPEYQQVYPDSSGTEQIRAVLDWLYNYDRTPPMSARSSPAR